MPLHLLQHPLASHLVTHLRDKTTKPAQFRTLAFRLSQLLAIEATRDLATAVRHIETPLEPKAMVAAFRLWDEKIGAQKTR